MWGGFWFVVNSTGRMWAYLFERAAGRGGFGLICEELELLRLLLAVILLVLRLRLLMVRLCLLL